jgi:hypothetical protein
VLANAAGIASFSGLAGTATVLAGMEFAVLMPAELKFSGFAELEFAELKFLNFRSVVFSSAIFFVI